MLAGKKFKEDTSDESMIFCRLACPRFSPKAISLCILPLFPSQAKGPLACRFLPILVYEVNLSDRISSYFSSSSPLSICFFLDSRFSLPFSSLRKFKILFSFVFCSLYLLILLISSSLI
ncbi:hypothetical protein ACLOJK_022968 [Asimina triloba]